MEVKKEYIKLQKEHLRSA